MGAVREVGRLGGTPVKGTKILGGDAVGGEDGRTGAENEVAWTAPEGVAGATETVHGGQDNGQSERGPASSEKRRGQEGELGGGESASCRSSDGSESDDRDDGGSGGNSPNDENACGESDWTSGWSVRNGGNEQRSDCVQTGGKTPSRPTPHCYI